MTDSKWTPDRIDHYLGLCRTAYALHGTSGGYARSLAVLLPGDLDLELLRPGLEAAGLPMPVEAQPDPAYRGFGQFNN